MNALAKEKKRKRGTLAPAVKKNMSWKLKNMSWKLQITG
jgi:hypothetical protein